MLKVTFGVISAVISPIFAVLKALVGAVMEPFARIGAALDPLANKFAELKDKIMPFLEPLINILKGIGNILGTVVGGAVGLLVDGLMFLFDIAFTIFSSIAGFINTYLIEPIMSFVNGIGSIIGAVGSFLGMGGGEASAAGMQGGTVTSVNDAVISPNGDVISTSPKDFLIATQNPGELGGGKPAWVDEVISAFRETKDVYMDGKKVTAGVSNNVDRIGSNSYSIV